MAKTKIVSNKVANIISTKEISGDRNPSVYLSRLAQQNVREGEMPLNKNKFLDESSISTYSFTAGNGVNTYFNAIVASGSGAVVKGWVEVSIYIGTDNNRDYLWPTGTSLTSAQKNLFFSTAYNIIGSTDADNELDTYQYRAGYQLYNNSGGSLTYYLKFRGFVLRVQ